MRRCATPAVARIGAIWIVTFAVGVIVGGIILVFSILGRPDGANILPTNLR